MRPAVGMRIGMLATALLLASQPGGAATLANVSIVKNAGNTADLLDDAGNQISAAQSTAVVSASSASAFSTRYAAVVAAERNGNPVGTTTQALNGDFTITFDVSESSGVAWEITLDVLRIGAQTIVSDASGTASVALGALAGGETGAGSITSGSLGLAALPTLSNAAAESTSPDSPFNQTTSAILSGIGTGFAQSVILNFTFTASAASTDTPGQPFDGDQAALRMGLDSALNPFTADDYPGAASRVILGDGIFILAALVETPEPGTATLMGLGLAALAWRRRRG